MTNSEPKNLHQNTVDSFGSEWSTFDQAKLTPAEWEELFQKYFRIFPLETLPENAEGFDMGCGSGRWAKGVAPKVGKLNCIDPAESALSVAKNALAENNNIIFHHASSETVPLAEGSQDFGYSLGVLHHVPNTEAALRDCVRLLKQGAPFLLYLYYDFDNRPSWFRLIWKLSEIMRRPISKSPEKIKNTITNFIAAFIYWPLARLSRLLEIIGLNPRNIPLSFYRDKSFLTMKTDSRDRFGTPLEQRFSRREIERMMLASGLQGIEFSEEEPYWVAQGRKA